LSSGSKIEIKGRNSTNPILLRLDLITDLIITIIHANMFPEALKEAKTAFQVLLWFPATTLLE